MSGLVLLSTSRISPTTASGLLITLALAALITAGVLILNGKWRSGEAPKGDAPAPARPPAPAPEKGMPRKGKPNRAEEPAQKLLGSLAEKTRSGPPARGPESIDEGYAEEHGMWVCRYCEVLNEETLGVCRACGQPRSR